MTTKERVFELLNLRDYTVTELSEAIGFSRRTAYRHITRAHKEGKAHIIDWRRQEGGKGTMAAIYRTGPGEDAKQPKPFTKSERDARYWSKHRMVFKLRRAAKAGRLNPFAQLLEAAR